MIPTESLSTDPAAANVTGTMPHAQPSQETCGRTTDTTQDRSGSHPSEQSGFSYADFTPVKHRKNRKNNKRTILNERLARTPSQHLQQTRQNLLTEGHDWFSKASCIISDAFSDLSLRSNGAGQSEDHDDTSSRLDSVLCLGLGSPSSSQNANAQLAFLLEIAKILNLHASQISVYDPVFTEPDKQLFSELGINVLSENKAGRYDLLAPTLCFMPHCDMELYNSMLQANWTPDRLKNFILVGNRLAEYIDSIPSQKLKEQVPCLFTIAPFLECRSLPTTKQWPTAFNNTCVQYLLPPSIDELGGRAAASREEEDVLAAAVSKLSIGVGPKGAAPDTRESEKEMHEAS